MKVLSAWQPYASLMVLGFKFYETRTKPAPSTLEVGERFAIAATKQIKPEQELAAEHPRLLRYYNRLGLGILNWRELPRGCIVGTVELGAPSFEIANDMIEQINEQEYMFGDWRPGRWAWPLSRPRALKFPIPVSGAQGLWNYRGQDVIEQG